MVVPCEQDYKICALDTGEVWINKVKVKNEMLIEECWRQWNVN